MYETLTLADLQEMIGQNVMARTVSLRREAWETYEVCPGEFGGIFLYNEEHGDIDEEMIYHGFYEVTEWDPSLYFTP
jgi:hypothetical protein